MPIYISRPEPIYGSKENAAVSSIHLRRQAPGVSVVAETIRKRRKRGKLEEQANMVTAEAAIAVEEKRNTNQVEYIYRQYIGGGAKEIKAAQKKAWSRTE